MKSLLVLALALWSSAAFARPDTTNMTCREATGLVESSGAIVLSTGKSYLYERFVAHRGFCGTRESTVAAYVQTADNPSCKIGYACEQQRTGGGSSFSKTLPASLRTCVNGARNWDYVSSRNDRQSPKATVCVNGKYVRVDGS